MVYIPVYQVLFAEKLAQESVISINSIYNFQCLRLFVVVYKLVIHVC